MKVSEANSSQAAREREVYRQINSIITSHAGSKCVRTLLDSFDEAEVRNPSPCKVNGDRVIYTSRQLRVRGSAGRPVLCDLGEARIGDGKFTEDIRPFLCRAPEVILRKPWDKKVDIWNLGVLVNSISVSRSDIHFIAPCNKTVNLV